MNKFFGKWKKKNNLRKAVYRVRYLSDNCFLGNYYKFCLLMMQLYEKIYMITLKQLNFLSSTTYTELILHVWNWLTEVNDQTVEHKPSILLLISNYHNCIL